MEKYITVLLAVMCLIIGYVSGVKHAKGQELPTPGWYGEQADDDQTLVFYGTAQATKRQQAVYQAYQLALVQAAVYAQANINLSASVPAGVDSLALAGTNTMLNTVASFSQAAISRQELRNNDDLIEAFVKVQIPAQQLSKP